MTKARTLADLGTVTSSPTELNYSTNVTSDIQTQIDTKANASDAALTGTPTAPTATSGTNTTQVATTEYVTTAVGNVDLSTKANIDAPNFTTDIEVDNLKLDGNTISSTDTNGNIILDPNGTGNVGVHCIPSSIQSGFNTLQIGGNLTLNVDSTGASAGVYMGNNVYRDSTNSRWEYIYTDEATQYVQANGEHIWRGASSGTADTAITFSEKFRFGTAGQLGIGGATYGTSGQVLTSGGASAAPTWANASSGALEYVAGYTVSNSTTNNFSLDNIFTTDYDHYFIITRDVWITSSDYLNIFFLDSSGSVIDSGNKYKFAYQNAYNGTPTHQTDDTRNHLFDGFFYGGSANDNYPGYNWDFHVTFNRTISNDGVVAKAGGRYWMEWDKYFSWSAVLSEDNGTPRGLKFSVASGSNSFKNGAKVNVYGYALS